MLWRHHDRWRTLHILCGRQEISGVHSKACNSRPLSFRVTVGSFSTKRPLITLCPKVARYLIALFCLTAGFPLKCPRCRGHTLQHIVAESGHSKGDLFSSCSGSMIDGTRCKYFEWGKIPEKVCKAVRHPVSALQCYTVGLSTSHHFPLLNSK